MSNRLWAYIQILRDCDEGSCKQLEHASQKLKTDRKRKKTQGIYSLFVLSPCLLPPLFFFFLSFSFSPEDYLTWNPGYLIYRWFDCWPLCLPCLLQKKKKRCLVLVAERCCVWIMPYDMYVLLAFLVLKGWETLSERSFREKKYHDTMIIPAIFCRIRGLTWSLLLWICVYERRLVTAVGQWRVCCVP